MFQKKTLNRMPPRTKKLAIQCNEAEKLYRNLKRQVEVMRELEADSEAFWQRKKVYRDEVEPTENPDEQQWKDESAIAEATKNLF